MATGQQTTTDSPVAEAIDKIQNSSELEAKFENDAELQFRTKLISILFTFQIPLLALIASTSVYRYVFEGVVFWGCIAITALSAFSVVVMHFYGPALYSFTRQNFTFYQLFARCLLIAPLGVVIGDLVWSAELLFIGPITGVNSVFLLFLVYLAYTRAVELVFQEVDAE
jgi:hypothetical protein